MKPAPTGIAGLAIILSLALAGCETTARQTRITEQSTTYGALPAPVRQAVAKGSIDRGYTLEAVYMALGRPDRIEVSADARECHWIYRNFYYSEQVSGRALYAAASSLEPGKAGQRAFGAAQGTGRGGASPALQNGDEPRRAPQMAGVPREPAVPALRLEVTFHDGRVTEFVSEAEAG